MTDPDRAKLNNLTRRVEALESRLASPPHSAERVEAAEIHVPVRDERTELSDSPRLKFAAGDCVRCAFDDRLIGSIAYVKSGPDTQFPYFVRWDGCYEDMTSWRRESSLLPLPAAPPSAASPLSTGPDRRDTPATDTAPPGVDPAAVSPATSPGAEGSQAPVLREGSVHELNCPAHDDLWCTCVASKGHTDECAISEGFEKCDCTASPQPECTIPTYAVGDRVGVWLASGKNLCAGTVIAVDAMVWVQLDQRGIAKQLAEDIICKLPERCK